MAVFFDFLFTVCLTLIGAFFGLVLGTIAWNYIKEKDHEPTDDL